MKLLVTALVCSFGILNAPGALGLEDRDRIRFPTSYPYGLEKGSKNLKINKLVGNLANNQAFIDAVTDICNNSEGKQGEPGIGLPGLPGKDGMIGMPGMDGRTGLPGRDGMIGMPGMDGMTGLPGRTGMVGKPGMDGLDGMNGQPGLPGMDGKPGEDNDGSLFRPDTFVRGG